MHLFARILGLAWLTLTGALTVGAALALLAFIVYAAYNWGGVLAAFVAFWLGGTLSFGVVSLLLLPIRIVGAVLMAFGEGSEHEWRE